MAGNTDQGPYEHRGQYQNTNKNKKEKASDILFVHLSYIIIHENPRELQHPYTSLVIQQEALNQYRNNNSNSNSDGDEANNNNQNNSVVMEAHRIRGPLKI